MTGGHQRQDGEGQGRGKQKEEEKKKKKGEEETGKENGETTDNDTGYHDDFENTDIEQDGTQNDKPIWGIEHGESFSVSPREYEQTDITEMRMIREGNDASCVRDNYLWSEHDQRAEAR